jgi:hypothetical protein
MSGHTTIWPIPLTQVRNFPKAIEDVRQAVNILPKRALYRNNLALYASYGSDFETGEREARAVQEIDPAYATGFVALAFAQLGKRQAAQAGETCQKLEGINAPTARSGLGDVVVYEGRFTDAARVSNREPRPSRCQGPD